MTGSDEAPFGRDPLYERAVHVWSGDRERRARLLAEGAVHVGTEVVVGRPLEGWSNPWAPRFQLRSTESLPRAFVDDLVRSVREGSLHHRLAIEPPGPTELGRDAAIAFEGRQAVGVVAPQVEAGRGGLRLFGLVPSARGRGWSAALHAVGLSALVALGADVYEDCTDIRNVPMRRAMAKNGCQELDVFETWIPRGQG